MKNNHITIPVSNYNIPLTIADMGHVKVELTFCFRVTIQTPLPS